MNFPVSIIYYLESSITYSVSTPYSVSPMNDSIFIMKDCVSRNDLAIIENQSFIIMRMKGKS